MSWDAGPVASSSSQTLMLSSVDQEQYYYLDQEAVPTSASSLWYSDWQGHSYNTVQDPEKTPTLRPTEPSQEVFHFQDTSTFQQAQNTSYLDYGANSMLNPMVDPDLGSFIDLGQAYQSQARVTGYFQDFSTPVNPYTDTTHFNGPNATDIFANATPQQIQHEPYPKPDTLPRSLATTHSGTHQVYVYPTYDEIFKSTYIKRTFELDKLPKKDVPAPPTRPLLTTVSKSINAVRPVLSSFLSKEICVRICDHLEVSEIAKLGMTCQDLHRGVTRERTVWYRALRRMTVLNSVPLSFYPMKMSTTPYSMRIMADWPSRWLYALRSRPNGGHMYERRVFDCRNPRAKGDLHVEPTYRGLSLLLIPGGRYLIADDGKQIFFWDMYMGSRIAFEFRCCLAHDHPNGARPGKPVLEAYQNPRGGIRVIAFFERTKDKIGRYIVYDVRPRDYLAPSSITPIYRGSEHERGGLYAFKGDLLATLVGKILFVRNMISHSMERLTIHNDPPAKLMMFCGRSSIALVHMHGLAVYDLSPLLIDSSRQYTISPRPAHPSYSTAVDFSERMNKDLKGQGSYTPPVFDKLPLWHLNSDVNPLVFDIVRCRKGKETHQVRWRYEIVLPDPGIHDPNTIKLPSPSFMKPACRCINRLLIPNQWTNLKNFGICKKQILLAGAAPDIGVGVTFAPDHLPIEDGKIGINRGCASSYLFGTEMPDMPTTNDMQLCPVTGRVCYTTRTPYEIAVIDYHYI